MKPFTILGFQHKAVRIPTYCKTKTEILYRHTHTQVRFLLSVGFLFLLFFCLTCINSLCLFVLSSFYTSSIKFEFVGPAEQFIHKICQPFVPQNVTRTAILVNNEVFNFYHHAAHQSFSFAFCYINVISCCAS